MSVESIHMCAFTYDTFLSQVAHFSANGGVGLRFIIVATGS
jgi:hypothetical protein